MHETQEEHVPSQEISWAARHQKHFLVPKGKHPLTLLDSKVARMEFLSYAWMYPWELSHVSQVNWNPYGVMCMVHSIKPFGQFYEGIKVHG